MFGDTEGQRGRPLLAPHDDGHLWGGRVHLGQGGIVRECAREVGCRRLGRGCRWRRQAPYRSLAGGAVSGVYSSSHRWPDDCGEARVSDADAHQDVLRGYARGAEQHVRRRQGDSREEADPE